MILKICFIVLAAILWRLGGWDKAKWSGYRDVLIPLLMGGYFAFIIPWWGAILIIGAAQIIRMGYGAYDPENDDKPSFWAKVTHDRKGYLIRAIVGTVRALVFGGMIVIFTEHYWQFLGYVLQCGLVSFLACKLKAKDIVIEPLEGASFASAIFWIGGI